MYKFISLLILLFTFNAQASNAISENIQQSPDKLVNTLSKQLINELNALTDTDKDTRNDNTRGIVETTLLPYVDTKYVAYAILGKHLKKSTKEQREEFHQSFTTHLVKTYANVLTRFDNQQIIVQPLPPSALEKRSVSVKAKLVDGVNPTVDIYFKLRKNKRTGNWRVFDFVAEGISLLHSKHNEFSTIINKKGIEGTIEFLKNN